MARFVLVHGAFGGAWCWEPVIAPLEAAGHTVDAPDLPGCGADHTPVEAATLANYAKRVCDVLASRPEQAILVGHSMGGVVMTQATSDCPEHVASLVFVGAFMPANGQSLLDLAQLPESNDLIQANIVIEGDPPVASLSAETSAEVIYSGCTSELTAWAVAATVPSRSRRTSRR
jgi:pimeloyl-ACP methyl ester carboxylesterase